MIKMREERAFVQTVTMQQNSTRKFTNSVSDDLEKQHVHNRKDVGSQLQDFSQPPYSGYCFLLRESSSKEHPAQHSDRWDGKKLRCYFRFRHDTSRKTTPKDRLGKKLNL